MNQLVYFLADMNTVCDQIPETISNLTSTLFTIVKFAIPLILIIYGMLDFGRAVMAGEEKEIKEKQKLFIKRLIAAVMVFFIFAIVELILGVIVPDDKESIMGCLGKLINGNS